MENPIKIAFDDFFETLSPVIEIPVYKHFNNAYEEMKQKFIQTYQKNQPKSLKDIVKEIFKLKIEKSEKNSSYFKKEENFEYFGFELLLGVIGFSYESIKNLILPYWNLINNDESSRKNIDFNLLAEDSEYADIIANLFINGYKDEQLNQLLSGESIYINRFSLTKEMIELYVQNDFLLKNTIEDKFNSRFSNKKGIFIEDFVIGKIFTKKNESYEKGKIPKLQQYNIRKDRNPNIDLVYPSLDEPKICIESSYQLTTASGQTKKIDSNLQIYNAIKRYNENENKEVIFINFVDGAGWKARGRSDLQRFYDNCDYILNHHYLSELEKIIEYYKVENSIQSNMNNFL